MTETVMKSINYEDRPYRACVGIMLINDKGQIFSGLELITGQKPADATKRTTMARILRQPVSGKCRRLDKQS